MPGYRLDQPDNTNPVGNSAASLIQKAHTNTGLVAPKPPTTAVQYPGNQYVNDPVQLTADIGASAVVAATDTQVLPLTASAVSEAVAVAAADQELALVGSAGGSSAFAVSATDQIRAVLGTVTGAGALTDTSVDQLTALTATVDANSVEVGAPFDPTINITGSFGSALAVATAGARTQGYVQGTTYNGGSTSQSTQTLAFTQNVTAGDLIVVACGWSSGVTVSSLTSNQSSVWSEIGAQFVAGGYLMDIYWTVATTTGTFSITITFSGATTFVRLLLHQYHGYSPFTDVNSYSGHAGSTNAQTLALSATHSLVFAWCVDNSGVNSYNSPMATRLTAGSESTADDADSGAAGSFTVTCNTGGGGGGMFVMSFKSLTAPYFNQSNSVFNGGATTSIAQNAPSYIQPGTLLLVGVEWTPGATTNPTVTDTMGNTYTPLYSSPQTTPTSEFYANLFYAVVTGCAYQPIVTATLPSSSTFVRLWVLNYLGVNTLGQRQVVTTTGSVNPFSGTITTTGAPEVCMALMVSGGGVNGVAPSAGPFAAREFNNNEVMDDYLAYAPGTFTDTWNSNGQDTMALMAAFSYVPVGGALAASAPLSVPLSSSLAITTADTKSGGATAIVSALAEALAASALTQEKALTTTAESSTLVVGTANMESAVLASSLSPSLAISATGTKAEGTSAALASSLGVTATVTESKGVTAALSPVLAVATADGVAHPLNSAFAPSLTISAADSSAAGASLSSAVAPSLAVSAAAKEQTPLSAALSPSLGVGGLATSGLFLGSSAVSGQLSVTASGAEGLPLTSAIGPTLIHTGSCARLDSIEALTIHSLSGTALSASLVAVESFVDPEGALDVEVFFPIFVTTEVDASFSASGVVGQLIYLSASASETLVAFGTADRSVTQAAPPGIGTITLSFWEGYGISLSAGAGASITLAPGASAVVSVQFGEARSQ